MRPQPGASLLIFLFNVFDTFVTDVSFMNRRGHLFTGRLDNLFRLLGGVGRNEELHGNPKALVHKYTPSYGMVGEKPVTCSGSDTISSRVLSPLCDGKGVGGREVRPAHSPKSTPGRRPPAKKPATVPGEKSFRYRDQGQEGQRKLRRRRLNGPGPAHLAPAPTHGKTPGLSLICAAAYGHADFADGRLRHGRHRTGGPCHRRQSPPALGSRPNRP